MSATEQAFLSKDESTTSNDIEEENLAALDSMAPRHYGAQPQGFPGVSESLFDRIRARTAEQQQQSPPPTTETAWIAQRNSLPVPQESSYTVSGPADYSHSVVAPPHVPIYGPSRNQAVYSLVHPALDQTYASSTPDRVSMAFHATSEGIRSLWTGVQNLVASVQERMGGRVGSSGSGYNNHFLLREDSLEYGPATAVENTLPSIKGEMAPGYSMLSYGKTFCGDMYGFFIQLPYWGKILVIVTVLLILKFIVG